MLDNKMVNRLKATSDLFVDFVIGIGKVGKLGCCEKGEDEWEEEGEGRR